jgi:hypothetical protein
LKGEVKMWKVKDKLDNMFVVKVVGKNEDCGTYEENGIVELRITLDKLNKCLDEGKLEVID